MAASADVNLDKMILNNAILNSTLELLPDSPATTTIIPLRMKWYIASANATQEAGQARLMTPLNCHYPMRRHCEYEKDSLVGIDATRSLDFGFQECLDLPG